MQTYIAILRGINVSGKNLIKMPALKAALEQLPIADVHTYIQSGNIVFTSAKATNSVLEKKISDCIQDHFGLEVPVLVRSLAEWKQVFVANPFLNEKNILQEQLHITFLGTDPVSSSTKAVQSLDFAPDRFALGVKAVYVYCPNGYGKTKINNTFFEKKLGVSATTRNLKTVKELLEMAEQA